MNVTLNKNYNTSNSDTSMFIYADEFKAYLSESEDLYVTCDFSSIDIDDLKDMEVVDGKLVDTSENQDDAQENVSLEDIINDLLQDSSIKEAVDVNKNGIIERDETALLFDAIAGFDNDDTDVSFDDVLSAVNSIKNGELNLEETTGENVQNSSAASGTSSADSVASENSAANSTAPTTSGSASVSGADTAASAESSNSTTSSASTGSSASSGAVSSTSASTSSSSGGSSAASAASAGSASSASSSTSAANSTASTSSATGSTYNASSFSSDDLDEINQKIAEDNQAIIKNNEQKMQYMEESEEYQTKMSELNGVISEISVCENNINTYESELLGIQCQISAAEAELSSLTPPVLFDEYQSEYESRKSALESQIASLQSDEAAKQQQITDEQAKLDGLEEDKASLEDTISAIESDNPDERISEINNSTAALQDELANLEQQKAQAEEQQRTEEISNAQVFGAAEAYRQNEFVKFMLDYATSDEAEDEFESRYADTQTQYCSIFTSEITGDMYEAVKEKLQEKYDIMDEEFEELMTNELDGNLVYESSCRGISLTGTNMHGQASYYGDRVQAALDSAELGITATLDMSNMTRSEKEEAVKNGLIYPGMIFDYYDENGRTHTGFIESINEDLTWNTIEGNTYVDGEGAKQVGSHNSTDSSDYQDAYSRIRYATDVTTKVLYWCKVIADEYGDEALAEAVEGAKYASYFNSAVTETEETDSVKESGVEKFFDENVEISEQTFEIDGVKYVLTGPENPDEDTEYPLIVYLHGSEEFNSYDNFSSDNFYNALKGDNYGNFNGYILMPVAYGTSGEWASGTGTVGEKIQEEVINFIEENNIDTEHVSLLGYSAGANGVKQYVNWTYEDGGYIFNKAAMISGSWNASSYQLDELHCDVVGYVGGSSASDGGYNTMTTLFANHDEDLNILDGEGHDSVVKAALTSDDNENGISDLLESLLTR